MKGKKYAIPFVGAIIERTLANGDKEILMQTRWKPDRDPIYSGTLEFAAGVFDGEYENVYKALEREIQEETGLQLERIIEDSQTEVYKPQENDGSFGFRPFCCVQQIENGKPWIGFIFRCTVKDGQPKNQESETRDVKWMKIEEIKDIFENSPEKLFTLEIAAWDYYFKEVYK
jgi:8-oxo-dGTP diphosphatase